ncbi:multidrug resistance protein 3 [Corynascus novoguineensis]|uniref:Multidrug resistance protein 3 n=1 Tax=Corynascus novoguineensis TaxID=1126955 RepID=A0AAN7HQ49_9PEZI|nr:multidrug resistance protein 3 [Corynascus novoguineensis]
METDTSGRDSQTGRTVEKGAEIETTVTETDSASDDSGPGEFNYLAGWRLHVITLGLNLGLFLVNFEITIVSTALVSITNDLHEFKRSSWVITAYLITYVAGIVIWAKLSDLFGRKQTCIAALLIFAAFSGGCGAAQSVVQLAVCRAFQGIGGSGIYAVAMVMLYELVRPHRYPLYTATVTVVVALAFALGPLLGGLITDRASWRWVFLINVPFAALAAAVLFLATPSDFPLNNRLRSTAPKQQQGRHPGSSNLARLRAVDFSGGFLMLAATALLITGLEEAASHLDWRGATVLGPLIASAALWAAFLANSWRVSTREGGEKSGRGQSVVEPVFPWRFCTSRVVVGLLLTSFMTGAVSITCIFQLPLRYQTSAGLSALQAGLRLIPFSVCGPLGTVFCAVLSKKRRVPPIYLAIAGELMQIIGLVFLARGDPADPDWRGLYGLEVVVGIGFGLCLGAVSLMVPFVVEKRDLAVGAAAPVQLRFLGSATVISIVTAVGNTWLRDELSGTLTPEQIQAIFRSSDAIRALPTEELERMVRGRFVESFNLQMHIVLGFAVAGVFTVLLMWQRNQVRVP